MYEGNLAVELIAEATADSDIAGVGQVLITVRMENHVSGFGQFAIVRGVVTQDIDDKHVEVELALLDILQALIVPHTSITTHMKGRIRMLLPEPYSMSWASNELTVSAFCCPKRMDATLSATS